MAAPSTSPVSSSESTTTQATTSTSAATSTNTQIAGAANSSQQNPPDKLSNMDQLRTSYPALYKVIMNGLASNMCTQCQQFDDKMKEIYNEYNQDQGG